MIDNPIKRGRKYIIKEKIDASTPAELKKIGKFKMGAPFYEVVPICKYDPVKGKYETGLDEYSADFQLSDPKKIEQLKTERKELIEYYKAQVATEQGDVKEYLSKLSIKLHHNKVIDTTDVHNWFLLFLLMNGTTVTPKSQIGNPEYNTSNYYIEDMEYSKDQKEEYNKKLKKAKKWLYNNIDDNQKDTLEVLRYLNLLELNQTKSEALLTDAFEKRINRDPDFLEEALIAIDETPIEDIYMYNDIRRLVSKGKVQREKSEYFYDGIHLGRTIKDAVKKLKEEENQELLSRVFE